MKTSKSNVRFRFGRLLSGILSAAMLFSAAAFQIPVSATDEETGGYEVLYDFMKDGYQENSNFSDNKTDTITEASNWGNIRLKSNTFSEPVTAGKVRFHFEFKHEYTYRLPDWYIMADEDGKFDGSRWLGLSESMVSNDVFKIGYYGGKENWTFNQTIEPTFEKDSWYDIDTIYDLTNGMAYYYINGNKIAESTGPKKIAAIGIGLTHADTSAGVAYYKNMKLDTGMAAEVTDTDDSGAVLEFTQPIDSFDASNVTVKCLETGETPTVTVEKVNDMKYKVNYSTGKNIGGDYALTFNDAFAVVNGISEKTIVYSQKPSVSYDYYINDDFEGYEVTDEAVDGSKWFDVKNPENQVFTNESGSNPSQYRVANRGWYTVNENNNKLMKINLSDVRDQTSGCSVGFSHATAENFKQKTYIEEFDIKNTVNFNEGITGNDEFQYSAYCDRWSMWYPIFSLKNNVLTPYNSKLGKENAITLDEPVAGNGMYHIKVEFGFAGDKKFRIYVDGKSKYEADIFDDLNNYQTSKFKFVMTASNISSQTVFGTAYTLIDNICAHNGEEKKSGIESVQYSADGTNYSPAVDKVDCETKYVKIDFTSAMDESTLSNINLSNGSNAVAATGEASNDNKTYTLTLTNKLATNTEYTLNIPTTVKTSSGGALARAYAGKITTTAGTFRVDLLDVQKNNATIAKSDIAKGDTLNAVVNITNTEGREGEAYLCICVYNDDVMTQVNFDKINLATEVTKSVPITVASADNIKVKAFLWEDFATMKPLIQNKTVE